MAVVRINPECLPLERVEFNALMESCGPFENQPVLAIALSGGIDSMALTWLAHDWTTQRGGAILALTVDHHLRNESTEEAIEIKRWCGQWGIEHHILSWQPPDHLSSLQEMARNARYKLLTDFCNQHNILHLLTAHQREDQSETFFFRLARGSGLSGLACMPIISEMSGVRLLRPLLAIPKLRLKATLEQNNIGWFEDPSNKKPVYTRNRIRQYLEKTEEFIPVHNRVANMTVSFSKFRNLLENNIVSYITNAVSIFPEGYAIIDNNSLQSMPEDIALKLLSAVTLTINGTSELLRNEQLERLYGELIRQTAPSKRSFGGLFFIYKSQSAHWIVCREPSAIQAIVETHKATSVLWDNRFQLEWKGKNTAITISALGQDGIKMLKEQEGHMPKHNVAKLKMVLATIPSFWHLEKVIAIPHINYVHTDYKHLEFSARFTPVNSLAGPAFVSLNSPLTA